MCHCSRRHRDHLQLFLLLFVCRLGRVQRRCIRRLRRRDDRRGRDGDHRTHYFRRRQRQRRQVYELTRRFAGTDDRRESRRRLRCLSRRQRLL